MSGKFFNMLPCPDQSTRTEADSSGGKETSAFFFRIYDLSGTPVICFRQLCQSMLQGGCSITSLEVMADMCSPPGPMRSLQPANLLVSRGVCKDSFGVEMLLCM